MSFAFNLSNKRATLLAVALFMFEKDIVRGLVCFSTFIKVFQIWEANVACILTAK